MWDGIFFCLGGAVLYVCGTSFDRDIELIKMAKRVNKLKDLAQLFYTESKFSPLVVLSGRVGSETPIICDYSPLGGVIVEKTTKLWFKKLNDVGSWIKDSSLIESIHKEVPWYLDDGTGRAFVVGARYSLDSVLIAKEEVFDRSVGSCLNEKLGFPPGIKMLGVNHVEQLLPIGASMTVIGQVVKDDTGIIKVQKPYEGHLFYVGQLTVDELLADLGMTVRWFKCASVVCVIFGVFMIAKHAVQYILGKRLRGKSQRSEFIDQKAPRGKGRNSQKQATKGGNSTAPKNKASSTKKSTQKPHQNKRKPKKEESTTRVLSDGPKRLGQDVKGSYGKAENESDRATKDRQMAGLRVIGLEQEYNPRLIFKFSVH